MTGAMFIAECLKQEGVTKVFGQCGHTNYALIDACHRLGIEYVSFRHEQHGGARRRRVLPRLAQARRAQRPPVARADQRADRRRDRRRRLDADGGDHRQHAVVSPRARAAPGHPLPRRRVAGRHLPPGLQARVARRRREVPGRRDAARAERRADRAAPARCCSTCRWTCSRSRSTRRAGHRGAASELRPRRSAPADGIADAARAAGVGARRR